MRIEDAEYSRPDPKSWGISKERPWWHCPAWGVKGKPGPHNFLDYILPGIWASGREGSRTFVIIHEMAQHLYELGFKSKAEIYECLWQRGLESRGEYRERSRVDLQSNGWTGADRQSGKPWKELPDDYMISVAGDQPGEDSIIVCGADEEVCIQITGGPRAYAPQESTALTLGGKR